MNTTDKMKLAELERFVIVLEERVDNITNLLKSYDKNFREIIKEENTVDAKIFNQRLQSFHQRMSKIEAQVFPKDGDILGD